MKENRKMTPAVLYSLALLGLLAFSGDAGAQAPFPFSDGFESGALSPEWTATSDPNGQIEVTTSYSPHEGSYLVAMDCIASGTYANNTLDLAIDLTGQADVELTYWYKEFGDEDHPEDGCFISDDGVNFYLVQSHNGGPTSWHMYSVDISGAAQTLGLTLGGTFVIRFSQRDNSSLTSDGICIDDVKVDPPLATDLSCDTSFFSAASGGTATFHLDPGPAFAGREYILLGTASGTAPGTVLPGGAILPLNQGRFFYCVRTNLNNPNFDRFNGTLDQAGQATALLDSRGPVNPWLVGKRIDFAFTTAMPYDYQSTVVSIDVTP